MRLQTITNFIAKPALALVLVASLGLTACQNTGNQSSPGNWGTKQTVGTLGGALAGGVIGHQFGKGAGNTWATAIGALAGAYVGNEIGSSLDTADRAALDSAATRAYSAPIGQQITWNNPQSGNHGTIVPTRDGYDQGGAYCREFNQKITVGGKTQDAYGTACQQPDGSWKITQ